MTEAVFLFGPFHELITDGAPEFTGQLMEGLMYLLQAHQNIPVPYRTYLVGQVERFQRTWKEMVSLYVNDNHDD